MPCEESIAFHRKVWNLRLKNRSQPSGHVSDEVSIFGEPSDDSLGIGYTVAILSLENRDATPHNLYSRAGVATFRCCTRLTAENLNIPVCFRAAKG